MTKSVTIVNTSNWDGENVEIDLERLGMVTLKPGEMYTLHESSVGELERMRFEDDPKGTKPFRVDGVGQVLPKVSVGWSIR